MKTLTKEATVKVFVATVCAATFAATGTAYAAYSYTTGGHAANVDASDYRYHIYACDLADDGHQIEGQARMRSGANNYVRDSAGGGCSHLDGNVIIDEFRACRLELFDTCGPWRIPSR